MTRIKRFSLPLLLILLIVFLAACTKSGCAEHIDDDDDEICDECGESTVCDECIDENEDDFCDVCYKLLLKKDPHECRDQDNNGKCDVCKKKVPFVATYHATMTIKDYGTIHIELYGNQAPLTVANFVKLANEGKYNGSTFHRIIDGFMAQGGKVTGASSITGEFESNGVDNPIYIERGVIAMARAYDPDSATSQFFIVQDSEGAEHLNGDYAAFGKVTSGMDIIDRICKDAVPYDNNGSILAVNQPIITSITVHAAGSH